MKLATSTALSRRRLLAGVGAVAAASMLARPGRAQQPAKIPRIAFLWPTNTAKEVIDAYLLGLSDFGYVPGRSVETQYFPWAGAAGLADAAPKVMASAPDIVIANSDNSVLAIQALSSTLPIVFGNGTDPVGAGAAVSLARPGRNATGVMTGAADLVEKQFALLHEIAPAVRKVAILTQVAIPSVAGLSREAVRVAQLLDIQGVVVPLDGSPNPDFAGQFKRVETVDANALYLPADTWLAANANAVMDYQIARRVPAFGPVSTVGPRALFGYGANNPAAARKAGAYVDAILRGAKPGDLPIQRPTVFDLSINLTTAKALGITYPAAISAQATMVYE